MHIINAMFSRGLGGIEQSFVDYCEALQNQGHKVTAIIHPNAEIRGALVQIGGVNIINVNNIGHWDFFAKSYLRKILSQIRPDAIIAHGNRATGLLKSPARKAKCPIIGVTHNYKLRRQIGLDAMFATTNDLKNTLITLGQPKDSIYRIPNMIRLQSPLPAIRSDFHTPPVIGTMGRYVAKKGFDTYLKALAILKDQDIDFKAYIGGNGEEEAALKNLADELGLQDRLEFRGWVKNKREFLDNIDIFCLPSYHEPFGIILLEAFMHGKAVITTDSEGPSEIASDKLDALITPKGDAQALAAAIARLIEQPELAQTLAKTAQETVQKYDLKSVGVAMSAALEAIVAAHRP